MRTACQNESANLSAGAAKLRMMQQFVGQRSTAGNYKEHPLTRGRSLAIALGVVVSILDMAGFEADLQSLVSD